MINIDQILHQYWCYYLSILMFYVSTLINIDIISILNQAKDGKAHRQSKAKQKKCNMRREHIQTNTDNYKVMIGTWVVCITCET